MSQDTEDPYRLQSETRAAGLVEAAADLLLVPGLTVLYHSDLRRVGERTALTGLAAGREEALSRGEPSFAAPGQGVARPLGDVYLSRTPLRLAPGPRPGSLLLRRDGSRTRLAADGVPVEAEREIAPEELERGVVLLLAARLGISRTALYEKIDKSPHIRKAADLGRDEIEQAFQAAGGDFEPMAERLEVSKRGLQRQMKRLGLP